MSAKFLQQQLNKVLQDELRGRKASYTEGHAILNEYGMATIDSAYFIFSHKCMASFIKAEVSIMVILELNGSVMKPVPLVDYLDNLING